MNTFELKCEMRRKELRMVYHSGYCCLYIEFLQVPSKARERMKNEKIKEQTLNSNLE